jgi:hypothetical protein
MPLSEASIQRAVFDHIRLRGAPGVFAFHPMNGGVHQRGRRRAINASNGVIPGVPDVILIREGQAFALELKTEKGALRDSQIRTLEQMELAGAICHVAHGLDAAIAWLEEKRLLRGEAA